VRIVKLRVPILVRRWKFSGRIYFRCFLCSLKVGFWFCFCWLLVWQNSDIWGVFSFVCSYLLVS